VEPRRRLNVALRVVCLSAVLSHVATAQASQGVVELGAARLRQPDVAETDAVTAGALLRRDGQRYSIAASGGLTVADEGRSTGQGFLIASLLGRPGTRTRWEVGGALTAFAEGSLPASRGAYLMLREHFAARAFGGWAGLAVGGVEDAGSWSPTRTLEVASWFARWGARLTGTAVVVDTRSEPYGLENQLVTDPITYTDASLAARWTFQKRVELDVRGGARFISRGALTANGRGTRSFAALDAGIWVTPRVAVVAAFGRQLSDLARGTPDTRFAAVALRFAMHNRSARPAPRRPPPVLAQVRLALVSDSSGHSRLVVAAPGSELVELAATFTSWEPVRLVRRGESWELDRPLPSGAHRVVVRIAGGPWLVPANLPSTADDFGGTVGIITVP
jgi:hypothetical protein